MGLIKSNNAPPSIAPFSMKDIESQARAILLRAKQQAEQVLVEAQREAEELKKQAHAEGMTQGRREGIARGTEDGKKAAHQQAIAEHRDQLSSLIATLSAAVVELEEHRHLLETDALNEVVALSVDLARRVTKRQGETDPEVLAANLDEALKLVVSTTDVRLVVHPSQRALLTDTLPRIQAEWPNLKHVEIVADAEVAVGGCRVLTAGGEINAELDRQLERIVDDLLPKPEEAA